ncbi:MAG: MMPL family transporter, partial [Myxococcota bacterium]|nr:MMPL family transporter [Myxococcota bacterium]
MRQLGQLLARRGFATLVVVLVGLLAGLCAWLAQDIRHEDDLLAFLPVDNAEIAAFRDINARFGGLDVAIVGIEVPDAYAGTTLRRLDALTTALLAMPELDHVLSLSNVDDFAPDPMGGIRTSRLVDEIPSSVDASMALQQLVESRDHVVGTLVARDGTALVVYAFPAFGADTRAVALDIHHAARATFPDARLHLGGAPFISQYIYDTTQADMARLTPWAVLAIVLILLIAFRNAWAVALGLLSTGVGILVVYATMAVLGMPLNVVLGAMPVILFAVGSAYAIHMLARYSVHRQVRTREEAVAKTVRHTGPVVLTAGLTTAAGLGSFVMMDIAPLQQFGLLTAMGVMVTLLLSVTFVPAVITLMNLTPRAVGSGPVGRTLGRQVAGIGRHRIPVSFLLVVVLGASAWFMTHVDDRLDQAAFYDSDSAPAHADRFLREHFGGSSFVQIEVEGDLSDPAALRAVRQLSDRIALLEGVHRVQHVGDVIASVNDAMEGVARIPDNGAQAGLLYGFLTGNPAVRQLVDQERRRALVHVRLSAADVDATERTLVAIEQLVAPHAGRAWRMAAHDEAGAQEARESLVVDRIRALILPHGRVASERVLDSVRRPVPAIPVGDARAGLAMWLQGAES